MNVEQAIAALGDDVNSVVKTLQEKGIRGKRGSSCDCPIARYLQACGLEEASVCATRAFDVGMGEDGVYLLPPHVQQFIGMFDQQRFPQLEDQ